MFAASGAPSNPGFSGRLSSVFTLYLPRAEREQEKFKNQLNSLEPAAALA
jgi:hypothetical protein